MPRSTRTRPALALLLIGKPLPLTDATPPSSHTQCWLLGVFLFIVGAPSAARWRVRSANRPASTAAPLGPFQTPAGVATASEPPTAPATGPDAWRRSRSPAEPRVSCAPKACS